MIDFKRLKDIREDRDITQEQIAEILGVKRSAYSLWEIGVTIIPLEYLFEFAKFFNYSFDYCLGLIDERKKFNCKNNLNLKQLGSNLKILRKNKSLTQEDMAKIIGVTQACITRYEKGLISISITNLYKYSKYFKISIHSLVVNKIY